MNFIDFGDLIINVDQLETVFITTYKDADGNVSPALKITTTRGNTWNVYKLDSINNALKALRRLSVKVRDKN